MDAIDSSLTIIVFCLAIFAVVWIVRKTFEAIFPKLKLKSKLGNIWNNAILPIIPIVLGGLAGGLFSSYPYPELFETTVSHVFFGLFCGLISGLIYRLVKQNILNKLNLLKKDK